jgi:hypothetical protein
MVTAFIPYLGNEHTRATVGQIRKSGLVRKVCLLAAGGEPIDGCELVQTDLMSSSSTLKLIGEKCETPYALLISEDAPFDLGQFALQRLCAVAEETGAGLVYADYRVGREPDQILMPLADWQLGSLRDDFDLGPLILLNAEVMQEAIAELAGRDFRHAALYALRLAISRRGAVVHVGEFLYSRGKKEGRDPSAGQFDYVDPKNRDVQKEMEDAVSAHLKSIGAYLEPPFAEVDLDERPFDVEASVVIPVKNRERTIDNAVTSALGQKTSFPYNVIVVDNYSTDGTTGSLLAFAETDHRVLHLVPQRTDLGIGGCWNEALYHPRCGRFAIQLDSDDLYKDETTLQRVVDAFRRERCAMVVGSYQLTDFDLHEIPPGIITHPEWTAENGPNNALRVNGFGAPRAFFTPVARRVTFPNVSYGEDYAIALAISREYRVGRIYEPIYVCRRWEGNSDAGVDVARQNSFNAFKDKIRTFEILARQRMNARRGRRGP